MLRGPSAPQDHGRLEEAEPLLRRALAAREATHGPAHIDTLRAMNNLAGLVEAQVSAKGRFGEKYTLTI